MKKVSKEWLDFANRDIKASEDIAEDSDLYYLTAFHCQQAIKKSFKAIIDEYDLGFVRTHDLPRLYSIIKNYVDPGRDLDILLEINDYYIESRYPGEWVFEKTPKKETIVKYLNYTKNVYELILTALKGNMDK